MTLYHGSTHHITTSLRPGEQDAVFASRDEAVAKRYAVSTEARHVDWWAMFDDGQAPTVVALEIDEAASAHVVVTDAPADEWPIHAAIATAREIGAAVVLIDWDGEMHDVILDRAVIETETRTHLRWRPEGDDSGYVWLDDGLTGDWPGDTI